MKIIIGLGNPGRKYAGTRHNAGFMAVDVLAETLHVAISQEKHHALLVKARIGSADAVLAKPQTYMNDSGRAVNAIMRDAYADLGDLIVVHDDLDLQFGTVRVKNGGGHGGHNGLRSIIEYLGSADFMRVRIGIGRPGPDLDSADYVLNPFRPEEKQAASAVMTKAVEAITTLVTDGPIQAMNLFNQK
jgi:PTH1 family peptidyl-tRNA hydrolase